MELQNIGVYKIYFKQNPKRVYIGSTAFIRKNSIKTGFYQRKYNHINSFKLNKHCNIFLQRAWNKYGEENFVFEILEICENVIEKEQYWIDYHKSYDKRFGYNLLKTAYSCKGYKKSQKHIENHILSLKEYYKNNTIYNKKINEELIKKVEIMIKDNVYYKNICNKLDIKKSTYYTIKAKLSTGLK